jgi:hypothetical protein
MDELSGKADGVIAGTVLNASAFVPGGVSSARQMTKFRILVTDVFKTGQAHLICVGDTIEVIQIGTGLGDTEPGLSPLFTDGDELVLAVSWWSEGGAFQLRFGADGVFELKDGLVKPRGRSQLSNLQRGRPRGDLFSELRRRASR